MAHGTWTAKVRAAGARIGAVLLTGGALVLGTAGRSGGTPGGESVPYRIAGNFVEVCACPKMCDTVLEGGPRGRCAFVAAARIEAGQRGETSLGGLAFAVVASAAEGRAAGDAPKPAAAVYVDSRASPPQTEALCAIATERFAARVAGAFAPPKPAAIHVSRTLDALALGIEGVADLHGKPLVGAFRRLVQLQYAPGASFPVIFLGRGTSGEVSDSIVGVRFEGEGRCIVYGKFDTASGTPPRGKK